MKKSIYRSFVFFLAGFIIPALPQAQIQVITLQPGPLNGIDADIRTDMAFTPNGSSIDFIANAWTAQGLYFVQRSLIRFDLSQIPANSTVINATLFFYTNLNSGHYQLDSGANASYLLRVLEPWLEQQVNWENQPAASLENPIILPQSISNTQSYELDVTSHLQDMASDPCANFGWLFKLQVEEKYRCMVFA
ncbi:MAG: DNRLRE domain-containing protein, partial [Bacteroidia bacterium]|nr:DNRLRE domain-containing protein [Bacteroidia bacterium]